MSDHGHQPVTRSLSMNKILEHRGLPPFRRRVEAREPSVVGPREGGGARALRQARPARSCGRADAAARLGRTRAYTSVVSTGEGVSVNLVGREPNGTVERADYERVRDEVAASLLEFEDPETGARPIAHVARKEEVLSGPYLDRAPDLLLQPAPLYSLAHARHMVAQADWLSGDHRPEGIYVFAGAGGRKRGRPGDLARGFRRADRACGRPRARRGVEQCARRRAGGRVLRGRGAPGGRAPARPWLSGVGARPVNRARA